MLRRDVLKASLAALINFLGMLLKPLGLPHRLSHHRVGGWRGRGVVGPGRRRMKASRGFIRHPNVITVWVESLRAACS